LLSSPCLWTNEILCSVNIEFLSDNSTSNSPSFSLEPFYVQLEQDPILQKRHPVITHCSQWLYAPWLWGWWPDFKCWLITLDLKKNCNYAVPARPLLSQGNKAVHVQ
jgi:hypothetical protein